MTLQHLHNLTQSMPESFSVYLDPGALSESWGIAMTTFRCLLHIQTSLYKSSLDLPKSTQTLQQGLEPALNLSEHTTGLLFGIMRAN